LRKIASGAGLPGCTERSPELGTVNQPLQLIDDAVDVGRLMQ
jgi:hypothetical protein